MVQQTNVSVVIAAAGTGGHVFPALAIAKALLEADISVVWVGTPGGFEVPIVKNEHIPYEAIAVSGIRGKGWKGLLVAPFKVLAAVSQSLKLLTRTQPKLVLGMGGYITGPIGIAARLKRIGLIIHEQNAIPGLTNQYLARISCRVYSGFQNALSKHRDFHCVGNPLRASLVQAAKSIAYPDAGQKDVRSLRLLVLGGSLGARTLNQWIPTALGQIEGALRPEVWHQTGQQHLEQTIQNYELSGVPAKVVPFIDNMEVAYAWADLVICRAGALTLSEVAAMALPAILIPYPYAVDDHQKVNAEHLASVGAAEILIEKESSAEKVRDILLSLIQSPEKLVKMRQAAWGQRKLEATTAIVDYVKAHLGKG